MRTYLNRLLLLFSTLLSSSISQGQEYRGISAYAMLHPRFPCHEFQLHIDLIRKPAIAILYGTFGTSFACLSRSLHLLKDHKTLLEIHISNESARRMGRMYEGEFLLGLSVGSYNALLQHKSVSVKSKLHKRIARILKALPLARPNLEILISSGLEDNFTPSAFNALESMLKREVPFPLVRNPLSPEPGGNFSEYHRRDVNKAQNVSATIINPDGISMSKAEYKTLLKQCSHCKAVFYWSKGLQGRLGKFAAPRTRTFMFTLRDREVLSLFH